GVPGEEGSPGGIELGADLMLGVLALAPQRPLDVGRHPDVARPVATGGQAQSRDPRGGLLWEADGREALHLGVPVLEGGSARVVADQVFRGVTDGRGSGAPQLARVLVPEIEDVA